MAARRTVGDLAAIAEARIVGSADVVIDRVSGVEDAVEGALTFAVDARWLDKALQSDASAVLVPEGASDDGAAKTLLVVADVRAALAAVLRSFAPALPSGDFTHPTAVVDETASRGAGVWIGPGAIVGPQAALDDGVVLLAGAYVGARARIGKRTLLHPRAVVLDECIVGDDCVLNAGCVIGADGFGFARVGIEHLKIPQIGNVVLGDHVEIGACATIDRAVTGATTVGNGTKIDNLVQVGHNVQIGDHCVLCGQVGIAGSAKIGRGTTAAGQAGIAGHLTIGEFSLVHAQAGVTHSIPPHSRVVGFPAQPYRQSMEQQVMLRRLPKVVEQVRALVDAVTELRKRR